MGALMTVRDEEGHVARPWRRTLGVSTLCLGLGPMLARHDPAFQEGVARPTAQAELPDKDVLFAAFESLAAPARYRLVLEPTHIGGHTEEAEVLRALCRSEEQVSTLVGALSDSLQAIRRQHPGRTEQVSVSTVVPRDPAVFLIRQGKGRFLQAMEGAPALRVLKAVDVAAVYDPQSQTLEFVEPSRDLALLTPESVLAPLPLVPETIRFWKGEPWTWSRPADAFYRLDIGGAEAPRRLRLALDLRPPHLPLVCWLHRGAGYTALVAFQYAESSGTSHLARAISITLEASLVSVYDYRYSERADAGAGEGIRLVVPRSTTLVDDTERRGQELSSDQELPVAWKEILAYDD